MAKNNSQQIHLSGQDVDEICSDYEFNGNKIVDHLGKYFRIIWN